MNAPRNATRKTPQGKLFFYLDLALRKLLDARWPGGNNSVDICYLPNLFQHKITVSTDFGDAGNGRVSFMMLDEFTASPGSPRDSVRAFRAYAKAAVDALVREEHDNPMRSLRADMRAARDRYHAAAASHNSGTQTSRSPRTSD